MPTDFPFVSTIEITEPDNPVAVEVDGQDINTTTIEVGVPGSGLPPAPNPATFLAGAAPALVAQNTDGEGHLVGQPLWMDSRNLVLPKQAFAYQSAVFGSQTLIEDQTSVTVNMGADNPLIGLWLYVLVSLQMWDGETGEQIVGQIVDNNDYATFTVTFDSPQSGRLNYAYFVFPNA